MCLLAGVHARMPVARRGRLPQGLSVRFLTCALLFVLFVPDWSGPARITLLGPDPAFTVEPVALDPAHPARKRVGDLVYLGGVQLRSDDPQFGGFSSLAIAGDRFTLLSDSGDIVRFVLDRRWKVHDRTYAELPDGPGTGWEKRDRDSESMSVDRHTGAIWVGFENSNALWRYDPTFTRAQAHVVPPVMKNWPENKGPEAMTLLPGGGMVSIAEQTPWPGRKGRAGVVFSGDPTRHPRAGFRFDYVPPKGYSPSDMTVLPDGRWLILNRGFAWFRFSNVLTIVDPAQVRRGATVHGSDIATLASPLTHDNFEGVTATQEGRATMLWLVSDDNQLPVQRSLLLKFRLDPVARGDRN
ncbi:esterase-like activity of phytase family protein [Sphingomonas sp. TREG-RG-20F-R18-01]|uniref:esterase-like activity of phytase family protein n=1 Tax=Sphingomonas sp. TREG-RG-20F-R18-01 TaxID=2914982 RepID=UPI001F56B672|nr:esterase-like activity of phytase family protein [Sphingomonas sp. TREG-RG-20F-R18-01]